MYDKRARWKIIRNRDGSWAWRTAKPDKTEACSDRSFGSVEECIADAKTHGYVVRTSKERRGVF